MSERLTPVCNRHTMTRPTFILNSSESHDQPAPVGELYLSMRIWWALETSDRTCKALRTSALYRHEDSIHNHIRPMWERSKKGVSGWETPVQQCQVDTWSRSCSHFPGKLLEDRDASVHPTAITNKRTESVWGFWLRLVYLHLGAKHCGSVRLKHHRFSRKTVSSRFSFRGNCQTGHWRTSFLEWKCLVAFVLSIHVEVNRLDWVTEHGNYESGKFPEWEINHSWIHSASTRQFTYWTSLF